MTVEVDSEQARPYIEAALAYAGGTHTADDVQEAIAAGRMQLWRGPGSAVVTEIIQCPRARQLNIFLAGGNLAEIEAMAPGILDWGRTQGCATAVFTGRRGWERTFLTRTGWAPVLVVFEKRLDGEEGRR